MYAKRGTKTSCLRASVVREVRLNPDATSARSASRRTLQLLDVACRWSPQHRFVGVERVLDLAIEIEIVLGRLRRHRRRWWLVRRDAHLAIPLEAGAGGNQASHRHVLLQPAQVIDLAGDRRFGEDARRFLEARRRDERV